MIALLQRVAEASVSVEGRQVASIGKGVLALVGVRLGDDAASAERLLERILSYRMFADDADRMSQSLRDIAGGLLLVPQFTLAADTRKGTRAGFSTAARPEDASRLFGYLLEQAMGRHTPVSGGVFGAHMQVALVNDGPVTFWLESPVSRASG